MFFQAVWKNQELGKQLTRRQYDREIIWLRLGWCNLSKTGVKVICWTMGKKRQEELKTERDVQNNRGGNLFRAGLS